MDATGTVWDPQAVIAGAKQLINASNYEKVGEARTNIETTMKQWVDYAQSQQSPDDQAILCIVQLWQSYAGLEIELRQFKQATKVYEKAVACPIAGTKLCIWLDYANFCIERKKFSNARKLFLRALQSLSKSDHPKIWEAYHAFMKAHIDPNVTMESLQSQSAQAKSPTSTPAPATQSPSSSTINSDARSDPKSDPGPTTNDLNELAYFRHIPVTLPYISSVPHLLFDKMEGEEGKEAKDTVTSKVLEDLSEVLRDISVFDAVNELRRDQRTRDRDTLYRWQDLIATQMKEGSELFANHTSVEQSIMKDPKQFIECKNLHMQQRRDFVTRCQSSQDQFIELCAVEREKQLRQQQEALAQLKLPDMEVTADYETVQRQRAIIALVVETEEAWKAEMNETSTKESLDAAPRTSSHAHTSSQRYDHPTSTRPSDRDRRRRVADRRNHYQSDSNRSRPNGYHDQRQRPPRTQSQYQANMMPMDPAYQMQYNLGFQQAMQMQMGMPPQSFPPPYPNDPRRQPYADERYARPYGREREPPNGYRGGRRDDRPRRGGYRR